MQVAQKNQVSTLNGPRQWWNCDAFVKWDLFVCVCVRPSAICTMNFLIHFTNKMFATEFGCDNTGLIRKDKTTKNDGNFAFHCCFIEFRRRGSAFHIVQLGSACNSASNIFLFCSFVRLFFFLLLSVSRRFLFFRLLLLYIVLSWFGEETKNFLTFVFLYSPFILIRFIFHIANPFHISIATWNHSHFGVAHREQHRVFWPIPLSHRARVEIARVLQKMRNAW